MSSTLNAFKNERFGDFFLLDFLGDGGMAEVFLAASFNDEKTPPHLLAVKRLRRQFSSNPDFIKRLTDEAKVSVLLSHPNIVRVHDLGATGVDFYISMEWINGKSLSQFFQKLRAQGLSFPPASFAHLMDQTTKAMQFAHEAVDSAGRPLQLVHQDVSPGNILITYEGTIKVGDFGVATAEQASQRQSGTFVLGKLPFMSPEQIKREKIDRRSDIYSLGVVMYQALCQRPPFLAKTEVELQQLILEREPDFPENGLMGEAPIKELIRACLAKLPEQRPSSVTEIQNVIASYCEADGQAEFSSLMESLCFQEKLAEQERLSQSLALYQQEKEGETNSGANLLDDLDSDIGAAFDSVVEQTESIPLEDNAQTHFQPKTAAEEISEKPAIFESPTEAESSIPLAINERENKTQPESANPTPKPAETPPSLSLNPPEEVPPSPSSEVSEAGPFKEETQAETEEAIRPPTREKDLKIRIQTEAKKRWGQAKVIWDEVWERLPFEKKDVERYLPFILTIVTGAIFLSFMVRWMLTPQFVTPGSIQGVELYVTLEGPTPASERTDQGKWILDGEREKLWIDPIKKFFEREYTRITGDSGEIIYFQMAAKPKIEISPVEWQGSFFNPLRPFRELSDQFSSRIRSPAEGTGRLFIHVYPKNQDELPRYPLDFQGKRPAGQGVVYIPLSLRNRKASLFRIAHEVAHILGARDKYDSNGLPIFPEGYADPLRNDLHPQHHAELMTVGIPVSPRENDPISNLGEVRIGPRTAAEIGWITNEDAENFYRRFDGK